MKTYDLNNIKAIPILDYLKDRGVEVRHNRCAAVWRNGDNSQAVSISPDKNIWYDFGEVKGGTIIDLAMRVEGFAFAEARRELAKRYNIPKTECGTRSPLPQPQPQPDFTRIGWAVVNRDVSQLSEVDLPVATRVLEIANGATDEATINDAVAKVAAECRENEAGIDFTDACDFVKADVPPPEWIVRDFIARGMKGDLCGGSKTNKTFLARQLAACVASGQTFLDTYAITEPHKVAIFDLELFPWNSQERMLAQAKGLGIDWERHKGNLLISHLRGRAHILRDEVKKIVAALLSRHIELAIIDPRYKLLKPGEDENTGDGLRGILEFRDSLAEHFATMLVTHDPKGDTSQKKTTDRGAGSYTAGADFDFRLTIDRAAGWKDDNRIYVVEAEGRARKTPPPIGVRFWEEVQTFFLDDGVRPVKMDSRLTTERNAEARAAKEATTQKAYKDAAVAVVVSADDYLLSIEQFDSEVAKRPGASLAINQRGKARGVLVKEGTLATCAELERKADGSVGKKKHGYTFISTPDRIRKYLQQFERR